MDTFKIKAVIAAAEQRSLSRAAELFSYTPSAFSHMLKAFEDELGVRLFERHSGGVTLTEEGRALYPRLLSMLESERELLDAAREAGGNKSRTIRIGTYSSIARSHLYGLLKEYRELHPDIRLFISVHDNLSGWLDNGRADVIFSERGDVGNNEWCPILHDRFCIIANKNFDGYKPEITREELYEYPHILTDYPHLRSYFDEKRFKEVMHLNCEDDLTIFNMVKEGFGLAAVTELFVTDNLHGVRVMKLEPEVARTLGFGFKKLGKHTPYELSDFIKYIKGKKECFV